jgi:hypothetical protein
MAAIQELDKRFMNGLIPASLRSPSRRFSAGPFCLCAAVRQRS